ncbi:MAG: LysE family transporter [Planctomycetota bacterium]|jgi:threonine/homoserine/homoserine lactone efflux protein
MSGEWPVLAVFAGSFSLGLTGAMPPGPMFAATVMHARRWGWRSGVLVSSGHGLLEAGMVALLLAGAGAALERPAVVRAVAVAGGIFLAALGTATVFRPPEPPSDGGAAPADPPDTSTWWRPFAAGIWTSATHPYWFGWWALAGAGAVLAVAGRLGLAGVAAFFVGHVLADFVWFTFVAATVAAGMKMFSDAAFKKLFVACGVMILGFGLFFVAAGVFFPGALEPEKKSSPAATSAAPPAAVKP